MSGLPEFNYPAFHEAAAALRGAGYAVLNPAETVGLDGAPWLWWMRQALRQVTEAQGVAMLPGWEQSRGARIEVHVAAELGLPTLNVALWLDLTYGVRSGS